MFCLGKPLIRTALGPPNDSSELHLEYISMMCNVTILIKRSFTDSMHTLRNSDAYFHFDAFYSLNPTINCNRVGASTEYIHEKYSVLSIKGFAQK
jgi:hypothetical protein